jgi:hypothetical protein
MPLFGGAHEDNEKLQAELARISALPLGALANEVMIKAFADGGLAPDGGAAKLSDVAGVFNPATHSFGIDDQALRDVFTVVAEGVQVLEHACLVRLVDSTDGGSTYYTFVLPTRLGRAAVEQGAVERILAGGAL